MNIPHKMSNFSNFAKNIVNSSSTRKNVSFSISSWFCLPSQGMKDFEILSRGSAFMVDTAIPDSKKFHIVTAAHVVAPWKFPKYYPEEWLTFVDHRHTYYSLEIRRPDGHFLSIFDLLPRLYLHPTQDLAALHFEDDDHVVEMMSQLTIDSIHFPTKFDKIENSSVEFHGHDVLGEIAKDGADLRRPIPNIVDGKFSHRTQHQTFLQTKKTLVDGMCGGPAITTDHVIPLGASKTSSPVPGSSINRVQPQRKYSYPLAGMVQGIVPLDHPEQHLRDLAVIIEPEEIESFVRKVERDEVEPLVGGESIEIISKDKDPEKMDINRALAKAEEDSEKYDLHRDLPTPEEKIAVQDLLKKMK